jgi:Flp pilus assembly protein TadG
MTSPDVDDPAAEQGGAVNVQMALLWAAMLALMLAVVQVSLVFYAGQLALTAAEDGVRGGRTQTAAGNRSAERGVIGEARRNAEEFLARTAGTALTDTAVTAELDAATGTMSVTVTGRALAVLPGFNLPISRQAVGGLEQVTP